MSNNVLCFCLALSLSVGLTAETASAREMSGAGSRSSNPSIAANGVYSATAYAQSGITKSGEWTHRHIVAADPDILPIGSRIKVRRAGRYSGEYVVADTGTKIQGRRLDIYMPSEAACKRFGVKPVRVQVLSLGEGTRQSVKQADAQVKADVATDIAQKSVGNAATQDDWQHAKATGAVAAQDVPASSEKP